MVSTLACAHAVVSTGMRRGWTRRVRGRLARRGEHGLANRTLDVEHRWLEHVVERTVTNRERPTRRAREGAAPVEGIPRLVHGAPDEGGNQWSSVVISGHQTPCPWRTRSEGGNQWSSVVISGHQWSSDALSMAHMIGGRRSFRPSARASASALPSWAS